jgi:hypothetical protein
MVPIVAVVIFKSVGALFGAMIRHTDKRIDKVNERSEKIVQGLKDDMKFDRTEKLLRKYDREWMNVSNGGAGKGSNGSLSDAGTDASDEIPAAEYNNKGMATPVNAGTRAKTGNKSSGPPMSLSKKLMMSTVGGASIKLSGALAQLWTLTADTVIGDDPVLLRSLKNAEIHAQTLTEENSRLREKLERYENEYGIIYDMNVGRGDESEVGSEDDDRRDGARATAKKAGCDGDCGGELHEVMAAEGCPGSEEDNGTDEDDEEVVEMVVTRDDDIDADPYLLAGNGPEPDDQDPRQDETDEMGDEAEPEPEPEPAPAPRRSRRTARRA